MSVCIFSRPTSCRPCLTSSMALSYRILSGCALLSTAVDLLTFFFLWKIWAFDVVDPSKNSAPKTQSARLLPVTCSFDFALFTVWPKLHLSRECRVSSRNPRSKTVRIWTSEPLLRKGQGIIPRTKGQVEQELRPAGQVPRTPAPPSVMHN